MEMTDTDIRVWVWGANNAGQLGLGFFSEQVSSPSELRLPSPSKPTTATITAIDTNNTHTNSNNLEHVQEHLSHAHQAENFDVGIQRSVCEIRGGGSHTLILIRCQVLHVNKTSDTGGDQGNGTSDPDLTRLTWYEVLNFGLISTKHAFPVVSTCFHMPNRSISRNPQIACGWDFSLFLNSDGQLFSSGDNNYGQLGRKSNECNQHDMTYAPVSTIKQSCIQISAGLRHAAAICHELNNDEPNYLIMWGDNSKKQLGLGMGSDATVSEPTKVTVRRLQGETVIPLKVRCGKHFTIVLMQDGSFYGCGFDKFGIFGCDCGRGNGKPNYVPKFTKLDLSYPEDCCSDIQDFQCGWNHVILLLGNGRIVSWGRNNFSQLGRCTTTTDLTTPNINGSEYDWIPNYVIQGLPDHKTNPVVSIASGTEHNLALTKSGHVYAWGWNEHENCGIAIKNVETDHVIKTATLVPFPTQQQHQEKVALIGCGAGNSFAITSNQEHLFGN